MNDQPPDFDLEAIRRTVQYRRAVWLARAYRVIMIGGVLGAIIAIPVAPHRSEAEAALIVLIVTALAAITCVVAAFAILTPVARPYIMEGTDSTFDGVWQRRARRGRLGREVRRDSAFQWRRSAG